MAKFEVIKEDVEKTINELKLWRSGWANDIREGWCLHQGKSDGDHILYTLYEISGTIALALENYLANRGRDKMALHITLRKLKELTTSKTFEDYDFLGEHHVCGVVTSGTKHHIRVMFECLEMLTQ